MIQINCGLPKEDSETILMSHGGGGRHSLKLIQTLIAPKFNNSFLNAEHDGAVLAIGPTGSPELQQRVAFSTDSYVVQPLFFPGGDIGRLAIVGTANDLAMCGAKPQFISLGLILEEGLPIETLNRILDSAATAAKECGVQVVTGDTKVIERARGDGLYINTSGIGMLTSSRQIGPSQIENGDCILISGDLGRHGATIMAARHQLQFGISFSDPLLSDCAPLSPLVESLLSSEIPVHCLRDLTRGGLTSALVEIALKRGAELILEESKIPVGDSVQSLCELLGLDPMSVACEGRMIAFVPAPQSDRAIELLQRQPLGAGAKKIGVVRRAEGGSGHLQKGRVLLQSPYGTTRTLDLLPGDQLPRIC